jgi:hypothetical protein
VPPCGTAYDHEKHAGLTVLPNGALLDRCWYSFVLSVDEGMQMPTKQFEKISLTDLQVTSQIGGVTGWQLSITQDDNGVVRAEVTHPDPIFGVLTERSATQVAASGENNLKLVITRAWIS